MGDVGGGVGLYISDKFTYCRIPEFCFITDYLESVFVEIEVCKGRSYIVGCIYRIPNTNADLFLQSFDKIIRYINKRKKIGYVLGDINIDLLKCETDSRSNDLLNILSSRSFFPIIT